MKKAVIAWGRMNPVTSGHEKLVNKVLDVARRERGEARIYLSHSQSAKKDPLQYKDKIAMAKKAFGSVMKVSQSRTLMQLMLELQKAGFTDIVMVAGSDRVAEYDTLLNKYNGKEYSFDSINVVSAGERDPDADGAAGMSATKLRQAAANGDDKTFMLGVPSRLSKADAMKLYTLVRKGLLVEEMEMFLEKNKKDISKMTDTDISDKELQMWVDEADWEELDEELLREWDEMVEEDALLERAPLTLAQRLKKSRQMKRLAPRLKRQREIKKFRMAPAERIAARARKLARNILRKKLAGEKGAHYNELSPSQKITVDRLITGKEAVIARLMKRLIPLVRKKEVERIRQARQSQGQKNEQLDVAFNAFIEHTEKTFTELREGYKPGPNVVSARNQIAREKTAEKASDARDKVRHDRLLDRARTLDTIRKNKTSNPYSGREHVELTKAEQALQRKADINNMPFNTIKEVYERGVEAWNKNPRATVTAEQWGFARVNTFIAEVKAENVKQDADLVEGGLWDNIHAKRKRIEAGSGEHMRKPGTKGAPTAQDFKDAQEDTGSVKHHQFQTSLKQGVSHARIHKDLDVDGDVDALDKLLPDEVTAAETNAKRIQKLMKRREAGEKQHTRRGVAFESRSLDESLQIERGAGIGTFLTATDFGMRVQGGFAYHPSTQEIDEEGGAGDEGTDKLCKKYKKVTPGQ